MPYLLYPMYAIILFCRLLTTSIMYEISYLLFLEAIQDTILTAYCLCKLLLYFSQIPIYYVTTEKRY